MRTRAEAPPRPTSDFEYELPDGRIALHPAERRDESRLLVLDRGTGAISHRRFRDVVELLEPRDLLVVNESEVIPARLLGRKPTGAPAEILLLSPASMDAAGAAVAESGGSAVPEPPYRWQALVRPGSKLKPGRVVEIGEELRVHIVDSAPGGGRIVELETPLTPEEAIRRYGTVPLPPYIAREPVEEDRDRYQTVYARVPGSVAAPTAGLHFTRELLEWLQDRGVRRVAVTLHVGPGTFRPIEDEDPREHRMHAERYRVPAQTAEAIDAARAAGGRIWAVGTTVVRTLESAAIPGGGVRPGSGSTELFIRPPYPFRVVNALLTNFHLPRSTLLMLVSAFGGHDRVMHAYEEAIREGYRFYSYGDAMAVVGGL